MFLFCFLFSGWKCNNVLSLWCYCNFILCSPPFVLLFSKFMSVILCVYVRALLSWLYSALSVLWCHLNNPRLDQAGTEAYSHLDTVIEVYNVRGNSDCPPRCDLMRLTGHSNPFTNFLNLLVTTPQWGAADAEMKVPSDENTELKLSPFKAWGRSVQSHTCYAYWKGFLPRLFLPFRFIHPHFFPNLSRFVLCWLWLTHGSCVGPPTKNVTLTVAGFRAECPRNVNGLKQRANKQTTATITTTLTWLVVRGLVKWITWR